MIFVKSYSQYNQGKIVLIDSTILIGLIKITKAIDVKFKGNKNSEVT